MPNKQPDQISRAQLGWIFAVKYITTTGRVRLGHSMPQRICYSHCANGAQNGVISIGQWRVFNHEKGAI